MLIDKDNQVAYLVGDIERNQEFTELAHYLRYARGRVKLFINSAGGQVAMAIQLINSIEDSIANITAIVSGCAISAAADIALSCNDLHIETGSFMMFHATSLPFEADTTLSLQNAKDDLEMAKKLEHCLNCHCHPFLSTTEIESMGHGNQIYIPWDEDNLVVRKTRHFGVKIDG